MTDFEREDLELQSLMGKKFIDETKPMTEAKHEPKGEQKTKKAADTEWHPTKERTWMDVLTDCAVWVAIFGGLNMLIFFWQLRGLMDESIAVPSMWVCCVLAGYGVGMNVWRGRK